MEQKAIEALRDGAGSQGASLISLAISMKRIADVICGKDDKHLDLPNSIMEGMAQAARIIKE